MEVFLLISLPVRGYSLLIPNQAFSALPLGSEFRAGLRIPVNGRTFTYWEFQGPLKTFPSKQ